MTQESAAVMERRAALPLEARLAAPRTRTRVLLAVLSGALLLLAFPRFDLWWSAYAGVAALVLATAGARMRTAWAVTGLAHLVLFLPLLEWTRFLGPVPWLLLAVLQAAIAGLLGPLLATAQRVLPTAAVPLGVAGAWVAEEAVRGKVPYGGFTWGRLAFSQADSPAAGLAALGGAPLVTAAVAVAGAALALGLSAALRRDAGKAVLWAAVVATPLSGWATSPPPPERSITVAAVQGNVPEGLIGLGEDRVVLDNHVAATETLVRDVQAGRRPAPDLVVWPENAVDQDPRNDPYTAAGLERARALLGGPFVVGAVLDAGRRNENSIFVWDGAVPQVRYAKQHLVPFGEYLPHRALVERLYPNASTLLPRDFAPGNRVGVLDINGVRLAVGTCYEVAFDGLARDAVRAGGQILVLPSNNASYGRSAESAQQLAMARLRAIEHGRAAVVATTSGISALVEPDGRVVARSQLFQQAVLTGRLPLSTRLTLATRFGPAVELALVLVPLALGLAATGRRRLDRRRAAAPVA